MKNISARRMAEVVLAPFIFSRRLPRGSGGAQIRVSTRVGGLKYLFRAAERWDPELLAIANSLVSPGDSVWDVGANVGLFSQACAYHAGPAGSVLSLEADLDAVFLLSATARLRPAFHAKITVIPTAIADTQSVIRFAIASRARAANSIAGFGSTQTGGVKEERILPCMTLDSLLPHFPPPDVLKIDVEGAELLVLTGATSVLETVRPKIYCEVTSNTREDTRSLLERFGYMVFEGRYYAEGARAPVSESTHNLVAIHQLGSVS